ncbi:putative Signal transduction histidine kinase [Vibrio nigripulchritudo SOn1]|uniref:histidine kinase n=1 Tax=Vibrio nigripulchritudo SOn1 TaxID=1238450 RepID=A0AAV2VIH1_9VIBR|nr:ATP-binding protein [Vibrio nigripulchritudo]CCO44472.1 putative Signal transduction histidine kinase [Vibrio nigripulchritudo SOn1]
MQEKDVNKNSELESYKRAYLREKKIRREAEALLESKSRELFQSLQSLEDTLDNVNKLQQQMVHNEKMAAIGQLAAGVTHEINNPVSFALSNIKLLSEYIEDLVALDQLAIQSQEDEQGFKSYLAYREKIDINHLTDDIKELIVETSQGLERIKEISHNFKKASHKGTGQFMPIDLNDCIETALKVVNSEIKHSLTLNKTLKDIPDIEGSFTQLQQVFINLFVNAKHATPDKGELTVITEPIDMGDGDWVKVTVRDTGKGIHHSDLAHIFEPFFTTKEVGKGTGLGLSISYEIIKNHKGSIEVASEPGVGTTFTLLLPGI